jgi:hypothetical protein
MNYPPTPHENSEATAGYCDWLSDRVVQQIYDPGSLKLWKSVVSKMPTYELPDLIIKEPVRLKPGVLKRPAAQLIGHLRPQQNKDIPV